MKEPARTYFISGTDTGAGKTVATLALMEAFKARGLVVGGMKPVASGCERTAAGLVSGDAKLIRACCSRDWPYALINPIALEAPAAPDIAAARDGRRIDCAPVLEACTTLRSECEVLLVEGIGGWMTPFTGRQTMADLVKAMGLPAILVVGLRLGCINHALLTHAAMRREDIELAGWIGNTVDPAYAYVRETVRYLKQALDAPCIGLLPYSEAAGGLDGHLNVLPL